MNLEAETARDDLAFLRALVSEGDRTQASLGLLLFGAGLLYGLQASIYLAGEVGIIARLQGAAAAVIAAAPTVIFLALLGLVLRRDRLSGLSQHGLATRAINAAFGAAGIASLTTSGIFGYIAVQRSDVFLWMLHPIVTFVVQGTVWYVAFAIRKRPWLGVIAISWHVAAVGMAIALVQGHFAVLLLILTAGLLLLMSLPGWFLWRPRG